MSTTVDSNQTINYARVAQALSVDYFSIYCIDLKDDSFIEYCDHTEQGQLIEERHGAGFFGASMEEILDTVHPDDRQLFQEAFNRDIVLNELRERRSFSRTYRLQHNGSKDTFIYVTMKASFLDRDESRIIVGLCDVDAPMRKREARQRQKEQEYERNLEEAHAQATIDALTGVKNKQAYRDLEAQLNKELAENKPVEFAVIVCDVNGLKEINDNLGHLEGDKVIKKACTRICHIFSHSPVFRVGGDEFVVISQDSDYAHVDRLMDKMAWFNQAHAINEGIIIACGMAKYEGSGTVSEVFQLADFAMYENKKTTKMEIAGKNPVIRNNQTLGTDESSGAEQQPEEAEETHPNDDVRLQLAADNSLLDFETDLPNLKYLREYSMDRIELIRNRKQLPMLVYIDFKGLNAYNREYGYFAGDMLIRDAAFLLGDAFPDALICRGADDDFVLIDTCRDDVAVKIEAVNKSCVEKAYGVTAGIRAGIATIKPGMVTVEALDQARAALREIGDDLNVICRFYSEQIERKSLLQEHILQKFSTALEENWIRVWYQPILRTETGKITALESLARWQDPDQGLIPPNAFIPILSRHHLLYKLDLYMAEQICLEHKERLQAGLPAIPVSLNLSAQDFEHADIPDQLKEVLTRYDLPAKTIIIEITEQDIARATTHFQAELERLHAFGFKLWIDDFGSGYSSLNVFSQYHVDRIKFDMNLVQHLDDGNGANRIILESISNMCTKLDVRTLSEGVEKPEQWDFLKQIHCQMVQGFYFFKPGPQEETIRTLKDVGQSLSIESEEERNRLEEAAQK